MSALKSPLATPGSVRSADSRTQEGFLQVLRTCPQPSRVEAALRLLLTQWDTPESPHEPNAALLLPITLIEMLNLLIERTEDEWLEVRKKISFVFGTLVSRGYGDVMADALLYGRLQTTSIGEAHASRIDMTNAMNVNDTDANASFNRMKLLLNRLADAHGTVERCVPTADVFRTFIRVPVLLELILSTSEFPDGKGCNRSTSTYVPPKVIRFGESCLGRLCTSVASDTTVLCTETWRSLTTALCTDKGLAAPFLLYYYNEFAGTLLGCLEGSNFVTTLHALELLAAILEDAAFLKARVKFAESPALLCALLTLTNNPSAHIRFLTFDALKVFIAKSNKPAPIRYILYVNRETLARYVGDYSTEDDTIDKHLEMEKQKLLQNLVSLEPLSHEEELLIDAE